MKRVSTPPDKAAVAAVVDPAAALIHVGRGEVTPATAALSLGYGEARQLVDGLAGLLVLADPAGGAR